MDHGWEWLGHIAGLRWKVVWWWHVQVDVAREWCHSFAGRCNVKCVQAMNKFTWHLWPVFGHMRVFLVKVIFIFQQGNGRVFEVTWQWKCIIGRLNRCWKVVHCANHISDHGFCRVAPLPWCPGKETISWQRSQVRLENELILPNLVPQLEWSWLQRISEDANFIDQDTFQDAVRETCWFI